MWRLAAKRASLREIWFVGDSFCLPTRSLLGSSHKSALAEQGQGTGLKNVFKMKLGPAGFYRQGSSFLVGEEWDAMSTGFEKLSTSSGSRLNSVKGIATAAAAEAETVSSEEEVSVIEEMQGILEEISRGEQVKDHHTTKQRGRSIGGMNETKYFALRRRQIKIETEAWEHAAEEYKELLADMCERKLAPNLPYLKSLFLGWFEPLRDAIAAEQQSCSEAKFKQAHAPYIDQLPADLMSVITMHKLMGLLMTGGEHGSARVVQAACQIGEAIEQEVGFSTIVFFVASFSVILIQSFYSSLK